MTPIIYSKAYLLLLFLLLRTNLCHLDGCASVKYSVIVWNRIGGIKRKIHINSRFDVKYLPVNYFQIIELGQNREIFWIMDSEHRKNFASSTVFAVIVEVSLFQSTYITLIAKPTSTKFVLSYFEKITTRNLTIST